MMSRLLKLSIGQISGGAPARQIGVTPPKRQIVVPPCVKMVVCRYCHKTGHTIDDYRLAHNLCLVCGSSEHHVSQCPHNRLIPREVVSVPAGQQKKVVSGPVRPMVPFQPRQPPPLQQPIYQQAQKSNVRPAGPVRGKGKAYTLTVDQTDALVDVVIGIISVHSVPAYVLFDSDDTHCFI